MRVEEMYLIKAEGEAMSGATAAAKQTLNNFVRTYRDPAYASLATDAKGIQDEIWMQRRVELWGEGLSYFDIMRLRKNLCGRRWKESSRRALSSTSAMRRPGRCSRGRKSTTWRGS